MKNTLSTPTMIVSLLLAACSSSSEGPLIVHHDAGADKGSAPPDSNSAPDIEPTPTNSPEVNPSPDVFLPSEHAPSSPDVLLPSDPAPRPDNPPPSLIALVLDASTVSVAVGGTVTLTAKAYYSDSTSTDVTGKVVWSVTPVTAATISPAGVLTGLAAGAATVQATLGGKTSTLAIAVAATELKLVAITVAAAASSVEVGNTVQLAAQGSYSDGSKQDLTKKVTWTTSDPLKANVSTQGVATGLTAGVVTFKATLDGKEGSTSLTVTLPPATLSSIAVTAPGASVDVGAKMALVATGIYSDGSKKDISASVAWTSSDATVATVSAAGVVTGVKDGTVTIKASLAGKEGTVSVKVAAPIALSSVSVTASSATVTVGGKVALTAAEVYSDGSKKDVTKTATWASGTATIATVDASGQVTALKAGSVVITATSGGKSGTVTLTVTDVPLSTIEATPAAPSIPMGTTQQFKATGTYADGSKRDITAEVDWTSSDTTKATISGAAATKGLATGKAKGTTTIAAALGGKSGTSQLTITDAELTKIVLSPAQPVIAKNTSVAIVATGTYSDGSTKDVTALAAWTSSATTVATVSNADGSDGVVTGIAAGTATITAAYSGQSATVSVKVNDVTLSSLAIKPSADATLAKGTTLQLSATGTFSDRSTQDLTKLVAWASSDATVATVGDGGGKDGLVTALKAGTTTVSAVWSGRTASLKLTVTPAALDSITLKPLLPTIAKGTTIQLTATGNYQDGTHQDITAQVTWSSSATTVATVANTGTDGLATALAAGTTTIAGALGGVSASTTLTVTSATLSSIAVTPASLSLVAGRKQSLTATGTFSDGSKQDLTTLVSWTSTENSVATVSNASGAQGTVSAVKVGTATIVAALGGRAGQCEMTVTAALPAQLNVTGPTKIAKDTIGIMVATLLYTDGTEKDVTAQTTWTSGTPSVASITSTGDTRGRISAVASSGSTVITAAYDTFSDTATVSVSNTTLNTLTIRPSSPTVSRAATAPLQLTATGTFADGSSQNLTIQAEWSSDHTSIATLSATAGKEGQVTGVAAGTATITAKALSKTATVLLTVTQ
jgi:trimeric autotransporter adhesin